MRWDSIDTLGLSLLALCLYAMRAGVMCMGVP